MPTNDPMYDNLYLTNFMNDPTDNAFYKLNKKRRRRYNRFKRVNDAYHHYANNQTVIPNPTFRDLPIPIVHTAVQTIENPNDEDVLVATEYLPTFNVPMSQWFYRQVVQSCSKYGKPVITIGNHSNAPIYQDLLLMDPIGVKGFTLMLSTTQLPLDAQLVIQIIDPVDQTLVKQIETTVTHFPINDEYIFVNLLTDDELKNENGDYRFSKFGDTVKLRIYPRGIDGTKPGYQADVYIRAVRGSTYFYLERVKLTSIQTYDGNIEEMPQSVKTDANNMMIVLSNPNFVYRFKIPKYTYMDKYYPPVVLFNGRLTILKNNDTITYAYGGPIHQWAKSVYYVFAADEYTTDDDFYYIRLKGTGPTSAAEINHFTVYQAKTPIPEWDYMADTNVDQDPVTHPDPIVIPSPDPDPPPMVPADSIVPNGEWKLFPISVIRPFFSNVTGWDVVKQNTTTTSMNYGVTVYIPYLINDTSRQHTKSITFKLQSPYTASTFTAYALDNITIVSQITIATWATAIWTLNDEAFQNYVSSFNFDDGVHLIPFVMKASVTSVYSQWQEVTSYLPIGTSFSLKLAPELTYTTGPQPTFTTDNGYQVIALQPNVPIKYYPYYQRQTFCKYIEPVLGRANMTLYNPDNLTQSSQEIGQIQYTTLRQVNNPIYASTDGNTKCVGNLPGNTGYIYGIIHMTYTPSPPFEAPPPTDQ